MQTDRELLEMAAKAAGYTVYIWGTKGSENVARTDVASSTRWNPLTDDGDAFRLAVKLQIDLDIHSTHTIAYKGGVIRELCGEDPYAATRRAIVRAAAEIGRNMG